MKRTLIKALLILTFLICWLKSVAQSTPIENRWNNLIKAISAVESRGNPRAVNGKHVGILQISPIVVDDCNRINHLKKNDKRYTYEDRYSKEKSIEMFWIIQNFYNKEKNLEKAIRLWNGGSNYKKNLKATDGYLKKVLKELERIEKASII